MNTLNPEVSEEVDAWADLNDLVLQVIEHRHSSSSNFIRKVLLSFGCYGGEIGINLSKFVLLDDNNTQKLISVINCLAHQTNGRNELRYWLKDAYYWTLYFLQEIEEWTISRNQFTEGSEEWQEGEDQLEGMRESLKKYEILCK